ncbi:hypothetical protein [Thioalkalivibrio thiocyanodenitrificans]|uniref:hypothetical protein n=1 Tax=Thioalkalivibrio thiocyanodenitrificans TaxID=243063 RepID=UPI0012EA8BD6|nr:hypothetical protein [Thioalkalivibrio thiocyanodenitrificans]
MSARPAIRLLAEASAPYARSVFWLEGIANGRPGLCIGPLYVHQALDLGDQVEAALSSDLPVRLPHIRPEATLPASWQPSVLLALGPLRIASGHGGPLSVNGELRAVRQFAVKTFIRGSEAELSPIEENKKFALMALCVAAGECDLSWVCDLLERNPGLCAALDYFCEHDPVEAVVRSITHGKARETAARPVLKRLSRSGFSADARDQALRARVLRLINNDRPHLHMC